MSLLGCTPETCDSAGSLYGYRPSVPASAVFVAIPIITIIASATISVKTRRGILPCILTCLASVLLVAGWATRIAGWSNPWDFFPFAQGTVMLTIAPIFISSTYVLLTLLKSFPHITTLPPFTKPMSNLTPKRFYTILKVIITKLGPEHSFIAPHLYPILLLPHDLISLLLQIIGYAIAFPRAPDAQGRIHITPAGTTTVLAGTSLHLATLVATLLLYLSVLLRARRAHRAYGYTTFHRDAGYVALETRFLAGAALLPLGCLCLAGRDVYRVASLAGGIGGKVARNQALFVGVEGVLVMLALVAAGVACHPGLILWDERMRTEEDAPFVGGQQLQQQGSGNGHLEEMGKIYTEQEKVIERNTSVRVQMPQRFGPWRDYSNV